MKKTILLLAVSFMALKGNAQTPVAHYDFNSISGATVPDVSGSGLNGTLSGTWISTGTGVKFYGSTGYVTVPANAVLNLTSWSIVAKVVFHQFNPSSCQVNNIVTHGTSGGTDYFGMQTDDNCYDCNHGFPSVCSNISHQQPYGVAAGGGPAYCSYPSPAYPNSIYLGIDTNYCIAATYANGTMTVYLNGVQVYSKPWTNSYAYSATAPLYLGAGPGGYFNGILDDIKIYNLELSQNQVLVACGQTPPPSGSCSDTCYWKVTGNNIIGGNNIFGTLTNDDVNIFTNNTSQGIITKAGRFGFGNTVPGNRVEITGPGNSTSGLRFSNLNSSSPYLGNTGGVLSLSPAGDVIWVKELSGGSGNYWSLTGNSTSSSDVFGTTNSDDIRIITNNIQRGRVTLDGNFELGTGNVFTAATASTSSGVSNTNNQSAYTLMSGNGNTINNSDESEALGGSNTVIGSYGTFTAGTQNQVVNCLSSVVALGRGNTITGSDQAGVIGEDNIMQNCHGGFIAGGHDTVSSAYDVAIGDNLNASGLKAHAYGSGISNNLGGSIAMGFFGNRTMVVTNRGVGVQMNPAAPGTFAPGYNLEVDADPGTYPVGSNIAFHNLPKAGTLLNAVLVDQATGELYMSAATYKRPAGGATDVISDPAVEQHTQPIANATEIIGQIAPIQYQLDGKKYPGLELPNGKPTFGLNAVELAKILPDVVKNVPVSDAPNAENVKAVRYEELVPLMIQALKEQQQQINELKAQLTSGNGQGENTTKLEIELSDKNVIMLGQNVPNPCDKYTSIAFYIPTDVRSAVIRFSTPEGKLLQSVEIKERGKGVVNIRTSELSAGVYLYTLIADGKVIDTHRMEKN